MTTIFNKALNAENVLFKSCVTITNTIQSFSAKAYMRYWEQGWPIQDFHQSSLLKQGCSPRPLKALVKPSSYTTQK